MSGTLTQPVPDLSPGPILEAVEHYRGLIVDLEAGHTWGPDQFALARESLIAALRRRGLRPGDRVIVAIANGPLFIGALTAILACEASPLLVHFKTPAAELLRYAERFGVRFLATESAGCLPEGTCRGFPAIEFGGSAALHWYELARAEAHEAGPDLRGVPLHPSSGSTGLPKIALRPGFAALEEARHYAATMAIDADDSILAIPPMSHAYGYGVCLMVPLLTGARIVSIPRFSAKLVQRALAEQPVTVLPAVPAMLDVLSFGRGIDVRGVRWLLTAGAILPRGSAEKFRGKTGATVCPLYGTTESGGISVATAADGRDVDGRVGPPMEGVSVDVRPCEAAAGIAGDVGKLYIRSSSMMAGYLDDRGVVTSPLVDGWFETGDLARIADDGTIHLRGRDSEVINVSGLKVVPCEVEEAIASMPGIKEVKVYAGEHLSGTQIVKAAVAAEPHVTQGDIRAHCEQSLVYYKRPNTIALIEALPRTPTGKIDRNHLP